MGLGFNLHAYRFDKEWSTFIVETPEKNWLAAGMDKMEQKDIHRALREDLRRTAGR